MSYNWYGTTKCQVRDQEGIDKWLNEYIGYENWCEWIWLEPTPNIYRIFSFKDPKHLTMFILKWT